MKTYVNKYMHLLNDCPAFYDGETEMIYFARDGMKIDDMLVDSLATIRGNENASVMAIASLGGQPLRHSYLRVKVAQ